MTTKFAPHKNTTEFIEHLETGLSEMGFNFMNFNPTPVTMSNGEDGYVFSGDLYFDITYLLDFNDVPPAIQRYIIARASVRAATQLVSNPELVQLLRFEEAQTRASALEYDCEQGDHTFFGFPQESNYRSYQPYKSLIR